MFIPFVTHTSIVWFSSDFNSEKSLEHQTIDRKKRGREREHRCTYVMLLRTCATMVDWAGAMSAHKHKTQPSPTRPTGTGAFILLCIQYTHTLPQKPPPFGYVRARPRICATARPRVRVVMYRAVDVVCGAASTLRAKVNDFSMRAQHTHKYRFVYACRVLVCACACGVSVCDCVLCCCCCLRGTIEMLLSQRCGG